MSDAWDPSELCRDDNCKRTDLHRKHLVAERPLPIPHHRPKPGAKLAVWQHNDPKGLTGAVARATSKAIPKVIQEIIRDVRDDYGDVTDRSVYRHVKKLVERGQLVKLDLGFTFAIYIRPKSRLLKDPDSLREYILGEHDFGPACTNRKRYEHA